MIEENTALVDQPAQEVDVKNCVRWAQGADTKYPPRRHNALDERIGLTRPRGRVERAHNK